MSSLIVLPASSCELPVCTSTISIHTLWPLLAVTEGFWASPRVKPLHLNNNHNLLASIHFGICWEHLQHWVIVQVMLEGRTRTRASLVSNVGFDSTSNENNLDGQRGFVKIL